MPQSLVNGDAIARKLFISHDPSNAVKSIE
jgi:hypothetical protein